jgi:hypothetical protein
MGAFPWLDVKNLPLGMMSDGEPAQRLLCTAMAVVNRRRKLGMKSVVSWPQSTVS